MLNAPGFIAVNKDLSYYTELSHKDINNCKYSKEYNCPFSVTLKPSEKSCVLSIFTKNKDKAHKLCNFRYVHNILNPRLVSLSSSSVLVYQTHKIILNCNGKQKIEKGCSFCIFKLPCACSVTTDDMILPPTLTQCKNSIDNITKVFPVNLILLQHFFNQEQLKFIQADSTFSREIHVDNLPQFKLYNHSFSAFLANDQKMHLNLSKMVERTKNDKIIFENLAEPLLEGLIDVTSSWPDLNGILALAGTVVASVTFIYCIWSFFKIRALTTGLLILERTTSSHALTVPTFVYHPKSTTTETPFVSYMFEKLDFNHLLLGIIAILCIIITVLIIPKCKSYSHYTFLIVEITNGSKCVTIPVAKVPLCPSYWDIKLPSVIDYVEVQGFFRPVVNFEWEKFEIQNKLTKKSIYVKKRIPISFYLSQKLKQVFKEAPYTMHIMVSHQNMFTIINDN